MLGLLTIRKTPATGRVNPKQQYEVLFRPARLSSPSIKPIHTNKRRSAEPPAPQAEGPVPRVPQLLRRGGDNVVVAVAYGCDRDARYALHGLDALVGGRRLLEEEDEFCFRALGHVVGHAGQGGSRGRAAPYARLEGARFYVYAHEAS